KLIVAPFIFISPLLSLNTKPLKPDRAAPLFKLKELPVPRPLLIVSVPEPLSVPLKLTGAFTVGLLPKGRLQLLLIVLMPVLDVEPLSIITLLKVTLLQLKVAPLSPSNLIVPLFALNVGEPETVSEPARVKVPEGPVNVPPEMLR